MRFAYRWLLESAMKTGLLSLAESILLHSKVAEQVLISCAKHFPDRLVVNLHPSSSTVDRQLSLSKIFDGISGFYTQGFLTTPSMDVRILLDNLKDLQSAAKDSRPLRRTLSEQNFSVLFSDSDEELNLFTGEKVKLDLQGGVRDSFDPLAEGWRLYENVVIGGSFDHFHVGHKILLTNAILRCTKKLTIGLTSQSMLKKKYLADLIESLETREVRLREFCQNVDPTIDYEIVPINDPFGPSIVDPDLQAVVASEETKDGAFAINSKRLEKGLSELKVHIFPMRDVPGAASAKQLRNLGSSWTRHQLLGSLLKRPEPRLDLPVRPYLIGLTGGSGSGKTKLGEYLATKAGTLVLDCDKAAHSCYKMGMPLHGRVVSEYGSGVLDKVTGEIDRRELGKLVFGDEAARRKLNQLVWPEVMNHCLEIVRQASPEVAVFDAALLIEAGWSSRLHETWVAFVSEDEAVRRIVERDHLEESLARTRLATQLSNQTRLLHANVAFYTGGPYAETHAQVDRAWTELLRRIA